MYIGYMGPVVFLASSTYTLTPSRMGQEGEGRWADHDLIHYKPVSEFLGPGLQSLAFDLILSRQYGVDPDGAVKLLRQMRDTGVVFPLIIGGHPISQTYWRLMSMSENDNYYGPTGNRIWCKLHVQLKEYSVDNYTEEQSKDHLYGSIANVMATDI